jgi:hypothetical protein
MPSCKQCTSAFEITSDDLAFYEKVSPEFKGKKEPIPPPTLCFSCRLRRRLAHRNERKLYHRKCDQTGRQIISLYAPGKEVVVYDQKEWWGDGWDPREYGQAFDFNRPFFEQFAELRRKVPRMALLQEHNENSDYTSNVSHLKNCYLLFSSDFNQDCCYGIWIERCRDCFDNFMLDECERTYESVFSRKIYGSSFAYFSIDCRDSAFLFDCHGCADCFMCWGLRNKQYHIANVPYSKEEYLAKRAEFPLTSRENLEACKQQFADLLKKAAHPAVWQRGRISESTGDFLADVQHCVDCFEVREGRDCTRVFSGFKVKDIADSNHVMGELAYENSECFPTPQHAAFNMNSYSGADLYYCDLCMNNCRDLFGCVGMKYAQYCILNTQYTEQEYTELVPKIIEHMRTTGEWGEFFPIALSLFGYDESGAQDHFPLTEEEVRRNDWPWYGEQEKAAQYLGPSVEVPDDIRSVDDDLCGKILICEASGKPYKIIPQELKFYRSMGLPVPRRSPDQRNKDRHAYRSPLRLWKRTCAKCKKEIKTSYQPSRPEIVYCENCYLQEVY